MNKNSKGNVLLGFILLTVSLIVVFVGLPYLLQALKSGKLLSYRSSSAYLSAPSSSDVVQNDWRSQSHYNDSVYKGRVVVSGINQTDRQKINLIASSNLSGPIDITGWKISTSLAGDFTISQGLPLVGFGAGANIILVSGNQVQILAGTSPISTNFRANKCLGLFTGVNFGIRPLAGQSISYNSCVQINQNDSDFYREWRVYTSLNSQIFDPLHDTIQLKDPSGFVVDQYQY